MSAASTSLRHLRVLDLSRVRAGPAGRRFLADFGDADIDRFREAGIT
jgi:crotonobetainyl-CoA:carnitine CoA-transferase CaiB-like acyl-CoA transferase